MKVLKYMSMMGLIFCAIILLLNMTEQGQEKKITIAFYNVENLFDTKDDPHCNDDDFLPTGKLQWNATRYKHKLENISRVISKLGDEDGPEIVGLSEIENDAVLNDLINTKKLKSQKYKFIHFDSPDRRGMDVALIYKASRFNPFVKQAYTVNEKNNNYFKTRSILLVGGTISKDSIYFFINHWPSRRGGEEETEAKRVLAATRLRFLVDSLYSKHSKAKVIIMGDFNDEPSDKSLSKILKAHVEFEEGKNYLFNPFAEVENEGAGSIKFKNEWDSFDQIIVSDNLVKAKRHRYIENSASVFDPIWLHYKDNRSNGPYRTYRGSKYFGGYSDHFPVYIHLTDN